MLTPQLVREVEAAINARHHLVHQTHRSRSDSPEAWERWEKACAEWHANDQPTDFLWENSTREMLLMGDQEVIEDSIVFLEADPWHFRSGYLKERIISGLKRATLSPPAEATQQVILKVCLGRNRREFRRYCGLWEWCCGHKTLRVWFDRRRMPGIVSQNANYHVYCVI